MNIIIVITERLSNCTQKLIPEPSQWGATQNTKVCLPLLSVFSVKSYFRWIDKHKGPPTKSLASLPLHPPPSFSQCRTISFRALLKLAFMSLEVKLSLLLALLCLCVCVISVKSLQSSHWLCRSTTTIDRRLTLSLSHLHLLIKPGKGLASETHWGYGKCVDVYVLCTGL